ncbi:MAG: amino acid ABC transporter substrate-binding protein, partial [Proteobacteria bacterium]|nr:amino acid ABC transporter substrate-binding protein [Pseudomonadota bacterium]
FTSQKLKKFGVYSDIVSKAFALEGIKVEYKFFPWARSYYTVKIGTMDGSLTWAPTEEKKRDVIFSDLYSSCIMTPG